MVIMFGLLWSHVVPLDLREERVDVIEFNQVCKVDELGRIKSVNLNQWIFWDWDGSSGEFLVRDWRRYDKRQEPPRYDHKRREWYLLFKDDDEWITIRATSYVLTRSNFDPEIENRKLLTVDRRRQF